MSHPVGEWATSPQPGEAVKVNELQNGLSTIKARRLVRADIEGVILLSKISRELFKFKQPLIPDLEVSFAPRCTMTAIIDEPRDLKNSLKLGVGRVESRAPRYSGSCQNSSFRRP